MTWPGWSISVQVAFNDNVWATSPTWTDITKYVAKATTTMGRQHELQQVNPSTAAIELRNEPVSTADPGGRFSPWNTASPYYNSGNGLTPGHPVRITATTGSPTALPINFVRSQGYVEATSVTSLSLTVASATGTVRGVANSVLVFVYGNGGHAPTGISDTRSNTWTKDYTATGTTATLTVYRANVTNQLHAGDSITITGTSANYGILAVEYSGIGASSPVDVHSGATATSATTVATSVTPTLSTDTLIAAVALNAAETAVTASSAFNVRATNNFASPSLAMADYQPGSTSPATSTWTWSPTSANAECALLAYKPATSTSYDVFYGYTQSWVPKYGQSTSTVTLNCYDGMALLNLAMLDQNLYEPQVLADGATAYWTCQDQPGSTTFADATGNGHTATLVGTGTFGGTAGALRAVADRCVTFGSSSSTGAGFLNAPVAPSNIATLMFEGWFQTTGTSQTLMSWECVAVAAGATGTSLVIDANGHPALYNGLLDGPIPTSGSGVPLTIYAQGTTPTNDGNWHHYVVAVPNSSANTTWSLYVDGVLVGSTASTSVTWEPPTGHDFLAGGYWTEPAGDFFTVAAFTGAMDQVAYYQTPLTAAQILNHYQLGSAGFVVQDSGARTQVVLEDLAGLPSGVVNCDTGVVQLQGATSALNQTTVSSYLQQVVNTERGLLYQDATGVLRLLNRWHVYTNPRSVNSQFTFTYDGTGQYYYATGLVPAEDDTDLWNDINVGRQGGTVQNASNSTSITKYGRRSLQGYTSLLFENDSDANGLGGGLLYQYKDPKPRVRAVQTSSIINGGAALPKVLGLNLLDRITVVWKPIDGSSVQFSQQSLVEQVQHTITLGQWDTTLAVTPIGTETFALWDSATWDSGIWGF